MFIEGYGECKRIYIANFENKLLAKLILDEKMDWIVEQAKKLNTEGVTPLFGYYGFVFDDEENRDTFLDIINTEFGHIATAHTDDVVRTERGMILTDVPNLNN